MVTCLFCRQQKSQQDSLVSLQRLLGGTFFLHHPHPCENVAFGGKVCSQSWFLHGGFNLRPESCSSHSQPPFVGCNNNICQTAHVFSKKRDRIFILQTIFWGNQ